MTVQRDLAVELLAIAAGRTASDVDLDEACAATIPRGGSAAGLRLGELVKVDGADAWVEWALQKPSGYWEPEFERALAVVAAAFFPEVWASTTRKRRAA